MTKMDQWEELINAERVRQGTAERAKRGRPCGYRCSDETRAKISAARKGNGLSDATKTKISAALKGKAKPRERPGPMGI